MNQWNRQTALQDGAGPRRVIAVFGGAGFIGSHLCERLIGRGDDVVCLDSFFTGRMENIAHLETRGLKILRRDVMDGLPDELPSFDQIYNLACPASPKDYQADPVKTALTCALGTLRVLERAEIDGARVLQASTSEVYGDPEVHPQNETYFGNVNPVGPRSCYDEGKRFAETLLTDFGRSRDVDVRIARIFNTYGPRMQADDGRVVSNFINQALEGQSLTLYGDGRQTRSFCFVSDLVSGLIRLMDAPAGSWGPINLGNPTEITVHELAREVLSLTGSNSAIAFKPLPIDDPKRRQPDISKARQLLGWSPHVGLGSGLMQTIAFFAPTGQPYSNISAAELARA